jgi:hypothetical protein
MVRVGRDADVGPILQCAAGSEKSGGVPDGIRKYVEAEIGRDYAETTSLVAPTDGVTAALPCRDSRTPLSPTFLSISNTRGNPVPPGTALDCPGIVTLTPGQEHERMATSRDRPRPV